MPSNQETLLRYIRQLASTSDPDPVSDAALLDRFITERDQRAFTALVQRHGAMVLQVCRWLLGNADDAEDAFQATFLVLARKAAAVQARETLAAWLHGVARRVALKTRAARRRDRQAAPLLEAPADGHVDPLAELSVRELLTIIDEEVQRLPEPYRLPLILCCLEGRSLEEAARQLGWTCGSVKGRLERGRARLHDRLVRRGLTLSGALAAVEASRATTSAAVFAELVRRTIPGALAFGASQAVVTGISPSAAALAGRIIKAMALSRLTMMAALLLTTAALGAGIALHHQSPEPASPRADELAFQKPVQHPPEPFWDQSDVPREVRGQVLDPHGKPLAGAQLYVGYSVRRFVRRTSLWSEWAGQAGPEVYPRRATTDADGRFHFRFSTAELDPGMLDDARPAVMATAAGYGAQWSEISPSTVGGLKLQLVDDLPASGRVLDSERRPVVGAKLVVQAIYSGPVEELTRLLKGDYEAGWAPRCWKGPLPGDAPTILTDAAGRWRCSGLGRDRIAAFALEGPRVPRAFLKVATRPTDGAFPVAYIHGLTSDYVAPRVRLRTIRGAVRDQSTRQPIAGVTVTIRCDNARACTGPDGRFEIHASEGVGYGLVAQPEAGQGYFAGQAFVPEQAGTAVLTQDLFLVRGMTLSGRVTNRSTGEPPKTATIEYYPLSSNQHTHGIRCDQSMPASTATVRADGTYSLAVLHGPGIVGVVASPHEDYAAADVTNKQWAELMRQQRALVSPQPGWSDLVPRVAIALGPGKPGALCLNKYHALALIDAPEEAQSEVLDLPLQTGQAVEGTLLEPDGQRLTGVEVVGLTAERSSHLLESATFTVTGLNRQGSRTLFFQHRGKRLGKVVTVRANAAQPVMIKLEPCGTVVGRLVDERGKPLPGILVRLGEDASSGAAAAQTDPLGRFQMALFSGQKYSWGWTARQHLKDFGTVQVRAGQVLDLGDLIQKSEASGPK